MVALIRDLIANIANNLILEILGERFSQYLGFKGISQKKLSELSCVSESTVSRFCKGGVIASDKLLKMIKACDDLSLEWFFYGTGEMIRTRDNYVTNNYGVFSGSDIVTDDSVLVKNSQGVRVNPAGKSLLNSLADKDRIIAEKDRIISERDETIKQLISKLLA